MSYDLQSKLLRLMETGEFIRVGDTKTTTINVRMIAATNRDLLSEVDQGRFREDLFYRINHFMIIIPPLRERVKDIPIIANHFLRHFKDKFKSPVTGMSEDFINHLELHEWNGNIRELKNHRACFNYNKWK
jgi:two-component system NtrC family response regulator